MSSRVRGVSGTQIAGPQPVSELTYFAIVQFQNVGPLRQFHDESWVGKRRP